MRELLQNSLMEKGRRSSKRQLKAFSIPSTHGKIKKKEKVNTKKKKKLSAFLVRMWDISKGLQGQPNSNESR